jgi:F420-non-reducing hydrogenase small subunit
MSRADLPGRGVFGRSALSRRRELMSGEDIFGFLCERGDTVFRQGDPGDTMYLIQTGAIEISSARDGGEIVLALLEKGDFFGEMVLLDSLPRSTTAKAIAPTRLLPLTRESLLDRLKSDPTVALHLLRAFCRRIERTSRSASAGDVGPGGPGGSENREVGSGAPSPKESGRRPAGEDDPGAEEGYLENISLFLEEKEREEVFSAGATIFRQGETGDTMYIIAEGCVRIYEESSGGRYLLATLGPRDFFGEMSLLTDRPRSATAVADGRTRVLTVRKGAFLSDISTTPELGLFLLQVMAFRLRGLLSQGRRDRPSSPGPSAPSLRKSGEPLRMAFAALSSCAGCSSVLLEDMDRLQDMLEGVTVVYCPLLMDRQVLADVDIAVVEGVVRTREDLQTLSTIRDGSRFLVAWGTCATHGGVPAISNRFDLESLIETTYGQAEDPYSYYLSGSKKLNRELYQQEGLGLLRRTGKLDDFVRVDSYLAGCPPRMAILADSIKMLSEGRPPERRSRTVCGDCRRKASRTPLEEMRLFPSGQETEGRCLVSQGVFCQGLVTRGGCGAPCTKGGHSCWGCRGPSDSILAKVEGGDLYDRALAAALARRSRISGEAIEELLKIVRLRTNSSLAYSQIFHGGRERQK